MKLALPGSVYMILYDKTLKLALHLTICFFDNVVQYYLQCVSYHLCFVLHSIHTHYEGVTPSTTCLPYKRAVISYHVWSLFVYEASISLSICELCCSIINVQCTISAQNWDNYNVYTTQIWPYRNDTTLQCNITSVGVI